MIGAFYGSTLAAGTVLIVGSFTDHVSWTLIIGIALVAAVVGGWMAEMTHR